VLVWNMTTAEHQHQIYPHRAQALWAMAAFFGAVGVLLGTVRRGLPSVRPS
jgi:hypothetical protein